MIPPPPALTIDRDRPEQVLAASWRGPGYLITLQMGVAVRELTTDEVRRLYEWLGRVLALRVRP